MRVYVDCVRVFHEKMCIVFDQPMYMAENEPLQDAANALGTIAAVLEEKIGNEDRRYLRAHLMIEELGETLNAMALGDEAGTLDGLSDLLYVLYGTAITFDLPIEEGFCEAHRSNMTKEPQPDDPSRERVRDKGPKFVAPDFVKVIYTYRNWPGEYRRSPAADLVADIDRRYTASMRPVIAYQELDAETRAIIDETCKAITWSQDFHTQVIEVLTPIVEAYHSDFNKE